MSPALQADSLPAKSQGKLSKEKESLFFCSLSTLFFPSTFLTLNQYGGKKINKSINMVGRKREKFHFSKDDILSVGMFSLEKVLLKFIILFLN